MKVEMIATTRMKYGTRMMNAGDTFEASPGHARLFEAIKKAKRKEADAPAAIGKVATSQTVPAPAFTTLESAPAAPEEAPVGEPAPNPRRGRRRRQAQEEGQE